MDEFQDGLIAEIPRLRRFARGLTANVDSADDLVQATLARALEKSDSWKRGTNLRAWLFTILHNLFVSEYRKSKREQDWRAERGTVSDQPSENAQEAHMRLKEVERALQTLPDEQRTVILMVALEGVSYEDAAEIVDVPVGTVRSRLSRGRTELRRLMEEARAPVLQVYSGGEAADER